MRDDRTASEPPPPTGASAALVMGMLLVASVYRSIAASIDLLAGPASRRSTSRIPLNVKQVRALSSARSDHGLRFAASSLISGSGISQRGSGVSSARCACAS